MPNSMKAIREIADPLCQKVWPLSSGTSRLTRSRLPMTCPCILKFDNQMIEMPSFGKRTQTVPELPGTNTQGWSFVPSTNHPIPYPVSVSPSNHFAGAGCPEFVFATSHIKSRVAGFSMRPSCSARSSLTKSLSVQFIPTPPGISRIISVCTAAGFLRFPASKA